MAIELPQRAQEQGTYIIDGSAIVGASAIIPNAGATWTLTKLDGSVVNTRQDVSVTATGSAFTIVLSDADLAIFSDDPQVPIKLPGGTVNLKVGRRVLLFECTYNSSAGDNLPLKSQVFFSVEEVIAN